MNDPAKELARIKGAVSDFVDRLRADKSGARRECATIADNLEVAVREAGEEKP